MAGLGIVRISADEDVFAAEETKVHTLSRKVISDMLETAAREEAASSAPPPASGVRETASRPAPTKSGMMPAIPRPAAVPVLAYEEDDDAGLEPTVVHERAKPPSLPRQQIVEQLMNEPPRIIVPEREPEPETEPERAAIDLSLHVAPRAETTLAPARFIDRSLIAIALAAFLATLVPALVLLHHLLRH